MLRSSPAARSMKLLWLMCLLPFGLLFSSAANETQQYADGEGPLYHSSAAIYRRLQLMNSTFVRYVPLKDTNSTLGRPVAPGKDSAALSNRTQRMFRVVNGGIITSSEQEQQLPTAFFVCNQHAREMITAEICFWLVRLLAQDTKTLLEWPVFREVITQGVAAQRLGSDPEQLEVKLKQWVAGITSRVKVEVVPVANQEGRDYIQRTGRFAQRKTVRTEVDLNRNWPVNRAQPGSGANELDPKGEEYEGPRALSEWQTRILYTYMKTITKPALYVDVHSGQWSIMCPWGGSFDYKTLRRGTVPACQKLFNTMQPAFSHLTNDSLVTPFSDKGIASGPGSGMLYKSQGSSDDTAYADIGFKNVLTVETYGPPGASDSGVSFTCPPMAEWVHYCNERNMCGTHVCKDRNGDLVQPSPGKRQAAVAAAAVITPKLLAASAVPSKSQSEGSAGDSESEVSAAGVAPMAFTSVPNASKDPFLSKLDTSQQSGIFLAFNPPTAAGYQMTVSRWCAALLFALDRVVSELQ